LEEKANLMKKAKQLRATRVQYGALPYRLKDDASVEVLLVTSRETKRWIIPKGWPVKRLNPAKAAAREAYEEAGVRGRVSARPIGLYIYEKRFDDLNVCVPCEVKVFPLEVKRQLEDWPESKERVARWFTADQAARLVNDKDLSGLILQLETRKHCRR
jgi:8-oxo-dGTP pyrophosphatase MutT (NUDIX family)